MAGNLHPVIVNRDARRHLLAKAGQGFRYRTIVDAKIGAKGGVRFEGNGFDVEEARKSGGLGLISTEERVRLVNGRFAIRSSRGTGTTVEVFVPLDEKGP